MRSDEKTPIALIAPAIGNAALARSLRRLAEALRAQGLDVAELTTLARQPGQDGQGKQERTWQKARTLRRVLREHPPRIAVSFSPPDHMALALASAGLPVRAVLWQAEAPGWRRQAADTWFWRLLPLLARKENISLAAPNAALAEILAKKSGYPAEDIIHLPLPLPEEWAGAPSPFLAAQPPNLLSRPPVILFPAPLERAMQPGMAVRAFSLLENKNARLVLPAAGPSEKAIRHMVTQLGLGERVAFVPPAELAEWHDKARLCCLPPRIDPFGFHARRALSRGLPVVGTRTPALTDIIGDNPALGALVEVTDTEGLSHALARYLRAHGDAAPRLRRAEDYSPSRVAAWWKRQLSHIVND